MISHNAEIIQYPQPQNQVPSLFIPVLVVLNSPRKQEKETKHIVGEKNYHGTGLCSTTKNLMVTPTPAEDTVGHDKLTQLQLEKDNK